ncbi:protein phosphatase CheZ [Roseibium album]|uniref:Chemotaxis regulator CheZ n=1 Tax=Roseibium album TaxID=311410 RepID=A0A0M6ZSF7_9HYPH|nr:protein phosphatase CheZ [Roseibium album]MBG6157032.1 chemotaxis regulatin CheY-phosphate phosphatase CheZ [Labrenzia sp. EL_162]MBG6195027.1 chemotaxis regulatin CheY-phosphate phosphatase CheZ [Labrenzia sp. EL_159]CTQ59472.1 chemotaxis regulator CheZ [Roseibium album]CTQ65161.1 chemotaxis regulator CheZ [Roseibium album]CTQ75059.1 chemotaxis regulator CheZ [Roseibium album]
MKTETIQEEPELIGDAEYHTLEQTLLESDRGRRFLKEYLNRHKTPETTEILGAIHRLEKVVTRERTVPDLDKIRLDIAEMHEAIERTKAEIANIKDDGDESNRFVDASHELDAIVTQTEGATQSILEAAEQIQEQAWVLRENGADGAACDEIDAKATEIFMACSFQDLTGQRTNKVVQVLRYLESRINLMIGIWGIEEMEAEDTAGPVDTRPDAHLLNGPQSSGRGVCQNSVDELMSVSDDVFDAALEETGMDVTSETSATSENDDAATETDVDAIMAGGHEPMDAAAIDDMFASAPADAVDEEPVEEDPIDEDPADEDPVDEVDEFANADPDAMLDEAAIEKLFDSEVDVTEDEAVVDDEAEAEADVTWELTEEAAEDEAAVEGDAATDPLQQLSEAERQALFN